MTQYEVLAVTVSGFALLISIATYLELKRHNARSASHAAVITRSSYDSFRTLGTPCQTIQLELSNLSQYTSTVQPTVEVSGLSVHWPGGCPSITYSQLKLPAYVVKTNDVYHTSFCLHTLQTNPALATVRIMDAGQTIFSASYRYDAARGVYVWEG
jgi:hypothetical protein